MRRLPTSTLILAAAVLLVQADLWLARSNMPQVVSLNKQLEQQRALNAQALARNQRAAAEIADLHEGLEMVEERARAELRMVKPDEILVQYARPAAGAAPAPSPKP
jgi:cell division protein FtsB